MRRKIAIVIVACCLILLIGLATSSSSALRVGGKFADALAVLQRQCPQREIPISQRTKYIPYREFHLGYGGGSLDAETSYYFPKGHRLATHHESYTYGGDGIITNVTTGWSFR